MPHKISAGILLFRKGPHGTEIFLVHPGGPFWEKRQEACWSIPKGEIDPHEDLLEAARREFFEETGKEVSGNFLKLSPVVLASGKKIWAFALEKQLDMDQIRSNTFEMEWPPHSRQLREFPEIDRAGWFTLQEAEEKIHPGQLPFLHEIAKL